VNLVHCVIAKVVNCLQKILISGVVDESRYVLEHERPRKQLVDETKIFVHKIVARIIDRLTSVEGSHAREALARGAPCEEVEVPPFKFEGFEHLSPCHLADILAINVQNVGVVSLVGFQRSWFALHSCEHAEAGKLQAGG
jgi:hypothetical protein